jgi:Ssp1 endopeptidase immunity protein Rap1a
MRLRALVVAAGLLWPACTFSQAQAGFQTGNDLYEKCISPPKTIESAYCIGYVSGVADTLTNGTCIPQTATVGQASDIVVKYLREHPEYRHVPASILAAWALLDAFPCKEQTH